MDIVAVAIFVVALAVIAFEWVHRTKAALVGAGLVVVLGVIELDVAIDAVDWSTLGLLVGMMILVGLTEQTGIFTYLALRTAQLSNGKPFRLVFLLAGVTGLTSAFLDNLTSILLIVPITLLLADILRISPIPLVLVEVLASNIGGTATLIGDPPNIMIGTAVPELTFNDFIVNLAPVALVTLAIVTTGLYFVFREQLVVARERVAELERLDPARDVRESRYVKRSIAVLIGTIVAFFLHAPLHIEPAVVALRRRHHPAPRRLRRRRGRTRARRVVDDLLLRRPLRHGRRAGGARRDRGDRRFAGARRPGRPRVRAMAVLWGSAAGSALVDNIPFTAAMIPVVEQLQADDETFQDGLWWSLALGACFGGNATLIAAAANVAAAGVLERNGRPISFGRFLAVGLPVTLVSLLIATVYLLAFQL